MQLGAAVKCAFDGVQFSPFLQAFLRQNSLLKTKLTFFGGFSLIIISSLQMFPKPHPKLPLEFRGQWSALI